MHWERYASVEDAWRDLRVLCTCYRGDVLLGWLETCLTRGAAHGSALVHALGSPKGDRPGLVDNGPVSDRFLEACCRVGLLRRDRHPQPTSEQLFFDVGRSLHHTAEHVWRAYWYSPLVGPMAVRNPA